jgi:multicomponent Na+:H+ antiporter subunit C
VLHALVLTGIVITVSVTGFAIALVRRIERDERDRQASHE